MAQVGRPRMFDRDTAVDSALHVFWEHGYEGTSLGQLKAAIGGGISATSFYAAFGSREALYDECVRRYLDTYARVTDPLRDTALDPRDALETALRRSAAMQCGRGHPKGCMVALAATASPSPEHADFVAPLTRSRAHTRAGIRACIDRGIASGALRADTDAKGLAMAFDGFLLGLSALARDGVRLTAMNAAIAQLMRLWDGAAPRAE